jgi:hypothetical protein
MVASHRRNVAKANAITGLIMALLQRFATECNARAPEALRPEICSVASRHYQRNILSDIQLQFKAVLVIPGLRYPTYCLWVSRFVTANVNFNFGTGRGKEDRER